MSKVASQDTSSNYVHHNRSLRPARPASSLTGQLGSLTATLVDDQPLEFVALCGVFLGVFSSLNTVFAAAGILVFGVLLYGRGLAGGLALTRWWPLLIYPLLLVASTIWSPDPVVTARYSIQLFLTALIGLYVGVFRTRSDALRLYFATSAALIIASIISGRQGASAEGTVLVGVLGSKDALALTAQAATQAGIALILMRLWPWRIAGLIMVPVGAYLIMKSNAATGVVTLALGVPLALFLRLSSGFSLRWKLLLAFAVAVTGAAAFAMRGELLNAAQDFTLHVLHKDSTLTGRTILWDHAKEFIRQRPWFGWGYKEAWIGSSSATTGLLRWAGILDGRTFYFHHTWLEAAVDAGIVGATILAITWAAILVGLLLSYFVRRSDPALEFFTVMMLLLVIRSFGETIMQPFFVQVALLSTMGVAGFRSLYRPGLVR